MSRPEWHSRNGDRRNVASALTPAPDRSTGGSSSAVGRQLPTGESRLGKSAPGQLPNRLVCPARAEVERNELGFRTRQFDLGAARDGIDQPGRDKGSRARSRIGPAEAHGGGSHDDQSFPRWVRINIVRHFCSETAAVQWQVADNPGQLAARNLVMALADLGFSESQERLYRALLRSPTRSADELAVELDRPVAEVLADCAFLIELGVLRGDPGRPESFIVGKPAATLGPLIERCEEDLLRRYRRTADTRFAIGELEHLFSQQRTDVPEEQGVERVEDLQAVRERLEELSFFTRSCVYSIQPGGPQSPESLEASRPLDQRGIRRGVEMRVIHEASVLDDELNRAYLRELVMGGAKVRVTNQQIDRMIIIDRSVAVVPVDPTESRRGALIVRHPGLLSGFLDLFHRAWQDAIEPPWQSDRAEAKPVHEISPQDRRTLQLLASGCTDETSAREVGVSVRHLRRTISRLMAELGANSRFEAGVEAARRGWL